MLSTPVAVATAAADVFVCIAVVRLETAVLKLAAVALSGMPVFNVARIWFVVSVGVAASLIAVVSAAVAVLVQTGIADKPDGVVDRFAVLVTMSVDAAANCTTVLRLAVAVLVQTGTATT